MREAATVGQQLKFIPLHWVAEIRPGRHGGKCGDGRGGAGQGRRAGGVHARTGWKLTESEWSVNFRSSNIEGIVRGPIRVRRLGHVDKWRSQRRIAVFPHWDHRHNFACLNGFSNVVRAIVTICRQNSGLGQVVVHDQIEARIVRCLTRRGVRSRGRARTVDAEVDLGRETTTRTAETLSRSPPILRPLPDDGRELPSSVRSNRWGNLRRGCVLHWTLAS